MHFGVRGHSGRDDNVDFDNDNDNETIKRQLSLFGNGHGSKTRLTPSLFANRSNARRLRAHHCAAATGWNPG
ncbi:hypothetical protein [uncultured Thiodictyon sp.]|uniref:hypothetical protein n=1 Tax=uncultured Thiodictyon sp. TaxID=1846217 RepID=UPI0025FE451F|nr:hypothetical protein [uncultured Thiodictyon sp.]